MLQGLQSLREAVADGVQDLRQQVAVEAVDAAQVGKNLAKVKSSRDPPPVRSARAKTKAAPSLEAWDVGGFSLERADSQESSSLSSADEETGSKPLSNQHALQSARDILSALKSSIPSTGIPSLPVGTSGTQPASPGSKPLNHVSGLEGASTPVAGEDAAKTSGALSNAESSETDRPHVGHDVPKTSELLKTSPDLSTELALPAFSKVSPASDLETMLAELGTRLQSLEDQSAEQEAAVQEARMARAHAEARCSTLEQERASVQREAAELAAQVERLTNQASANEKEMAVLRRGMATQKERQQGAVEAARQASLAATSVMRERLASLESALETALAEGRAAAEAVQVAAAATEAAKAEAGASTAARLQAEAGLREAQRAQREAESQAKAALLEAEAERAHRAETEDAARQLHEEAARRSKAFHNAVAAAVQEQQQAWEMEKAALRDRVETLEATEQAARAEAEGARSDAEELRRELADANAAADARSRGWDAQAAQHAAQDAVHAAHVRQLKEELAAARRAAEEAARAAELACRAAEARAEGAAAELAKAAEDARRSAALASEAADRRAEVAEGRFAMAQVAADAATARAEAAERQCSELQERLESQAKSPPVQPAPPESHGLTGLGLGPAALDALMSGGTSAATEPGAALRGSRVRGTAGRPLAGRMSPRTWIVVLYVAALHLAYLAALHNSGAGCLGADAGQQLPG
ncbi:hypothetical protein ACKKBG_A20130 [Auxenochlorella protothecoides x Auxenochlorella symbiontica]